GVYISWDRADADIDDKYITAYTESFEGYVFGADDETTLTIFYPNYSLIPSMGG
ncbi:unnamed protein product, partial [marine sediment metagenome]